MKRYVYFLRPVGQRGPIKIGCTVDLERRLLHYNRMSPVPLEVVASLPGDLKLERRFHAEFANLRSHHEWFRHSPHIDDVIAAINAGRFDTSKLPAGRSFGHRPHKQWDAARRAQHGEAVKRALARKAA